MSETKRERYIRILSQLTDCGADMTAEATTEIVDLLKEVPKWVPCEKRLPEEEGQYLVTLDFAWGKEIEMGDWFNGEWVNPNSHVTVAWMELPDPWKGSEDKE